MQGNSLHPNTPSPDEEVRAYISAADQLTDANLHETDLKTTIEKMENEQLLTTEEAQAVKMHLETKTKTVQDENIS